jgi:hypothetical protein
MVAEELRVMQLRRVEKDRTILEIHQFTVQETPQTQTLQVVHKIQFREVQVVEKLPH